MEVPTLFGLPAHPLVVHGAVVLLPLAVLATLVVAAVPAARRSYAAVAFGLALLAVVFVGLAQGSGEELEGEVERSELVEEHAEQGERVLPWAIGVVVVSGAVVALPLIERRKPKIPARTVSGVLVAFAIVVGVGATWTVVDVGHSGAKATWDGVGDSGSG